MAEIVTIERWLFGKLSGISGVSGRVYGNLAPIGATFPLILYTLQGIGDIPGHETTRSIGVTSEWIVRVIDQSMSLTELEIMAEQIQAALERRKDGRIFGCLRTQPFHMVEEIDGLQYHHLGGIYQIMVRE